MVVMLMLMLMRLRRRLGLRQQLLCKGVHLHGGENLVPGELVPVGGDDDSLPILRPEQLHALTQLVFLHVPGAGEDDGAGVLHLIVKELAEVLHIHPALLGVHHGDGAAQLQLSGLRHSAHSRRHVGQLAHAGGLDDDAVGVVGVQHLTQRHAEIPHQRAADAPGVHLRDLNACVLHKAAVNADLSELVFDQHQLLPLKGFFDELFYQRRLACAKKAGNNVNRSHRENTSIQNDTLRSEPQSVSNSITLIISIIL